MLIVLAWNDASKHAHPAGRPQETSATRPEKASDEELHRMTKRAQKMATRFRDFIGGSPDSSGSSLALKEAFGRKLISSGFAPPPQLERDALCDSRCVKICILVTRSYTCTHEGVQ